VLRFLAGLPLLEGPKKFLHRGPNALSAALRTVKFLVKIQETLHRIFLTGGELLQFAPETRIKMLGIFLAMSYEGSTV